MARLHPHLMLVGLCAMLVHCRATEVQPDSGAAFQDAGLRSDSGPEDPPDAGDPGDAGNTADTGPQIEAFVRGDSVEVHTTSGARHHGEVIAIYDANDWWHPQPELQFALFNSERFGFGLQDDSIRVLSLPSIASLTVQPLSPTYRTHQHRQGIVLERSPFDGVVHVITAHERYHLEEDGFGDFAWDLVKTDDRGQRFVGSGLDNAQHLVWDAKVYLPTAGVVVEVVRDVADNQPGEAPTEGDSNRVGINIGGRNGLYLLHFRQGTIPETIMVGARLDAGTYLGRVGNSGVSLEPHLHVVVMYWLEAGVASPRYYSVPVDFAALHVGAQPTGPSTPQTFVDPPSGVWISNQSF